MKERALSGNVSGPQASRFRSWLRQAIPYLVTILILVVIFHRVPIAQVAHALRRTPVLAFFLG